MGRATALLALATALGAYYAVSPRLWHAEVWWDVAWLAFVLIPAAFALVWLALSLWSGRGLALVGLACAAAAVAFSLADLDVLANFAKLATMTVLAWAFLAYFETVAWVVLVACIIPWVDAYSVWRGPTKTILAHHASVFSIFSFAFPIPGSTAGANLGLPDLLFFALFLAAAARFRLRVPATWLCLVASLGVTIALTVWLDLSGLPALPGLSLGFLLPNADLLWRRLRRRDLPRSDPGLEERTDVALDRPAHDL